MEINIVIRELLAKHNYISLPGLGSFVQNYEPAHPSADGNGFIAPKQSVTFDDSRTFNDEAIENYLCEKMGLSHSNASELLVEHIKRINEDISNGKEFIFESIGILSRNKKGKICFEQAKELNIAISTYGLKDIVVSKTDIKVDKPKTKIESQSIPLKSKVLPHKKSSTSKILIGISIFIAIAVLSSMFILIPDFRFWKKANETNNSLTSTDTLKKVDNKLAQTSAVKKDSVNSRIDQTITDNTVKKTALSYTEPKIQENKTFYLIVGSFGKLENAQKLAEKYNRKGFKTEIIQGKAMFRVSVNKFTDKNIALSEFNKFHNNNPDVSAWLLGV
ncbi:MAG: SPOR domain-containing protein [Bacteroidales bacterium]|nr:SPOR domain-containing protein [Bacteroidales bacterium]